ncbi:recombinase family protein [Rhodomicrobium vannielii]|uniref:recombinase family protein n=1 Tax=Rhodomicrobium vannielii TaxID=1069 RepID=UPI00030CDCDB|nr:recombinase family protein [Rhodomicrobium vannielii]
MREIFGLALGERGHPMGVKAIATRLNERGNTRRGQRFSTGSIYDILTNTTYRGQYFFNRFDSRGGKARPPSEWIELAAPVIIEEATFNAAQGLLKSRNPRYTPPRVVNGPTLLAGVARCGYCGAAMILNTGKNGAYRYSCCSRKTKEGPLSCRGIRIPMDRLDDMVIGEVLEQVLDPARLRHLLDTWLRSASERAEKEKKDITKLRQKHADAKAALTRLLQLVETGTMEAEDPALKERLLGLKLQRDECAAEIADLQHRMTTGEPAVTPAKINRLAKLLKEKLTSGSPEFRQAYARLLMREVLVKDKEIRITGSKAILARAASGEPGQTPPAVLSFVREWRTGEDSNSRPPDS